MSETPSPLPPAAKTGMREDVLHHDPLLDCLVELSRVHGRPATRAALTAGLPLEKGALTPSLFARAASRAGLSARVVRRPLERIDAALLPAVLLLAGDEACVLLGWDETGSTARLLFPDTAQGTVLLSRENLLARYAGVAIFARPHFRFDKRTPEVGAVRLRHWFWGALAGQWSVYRDVLAAALLINVIALAMPLFTMNVYDRVVPNRAFETLWVLALGVLLMIGVDMVLRQLRGYFIDLAGARIDLQLSAQIMERVLGLRMEARPAAVGSFSSNLRSFEVVRDFITSATVMPHAIYLHSALAIDRHRPGGRPDRPLRQLLAVQKWDVGLALVLSGSVNIAMLLLAAAKLPGREGTDTIAGAHAAITQALGPVIGVLFGVGLLASGLQMALLKAGASIEVREHTLERQCDPEYVEELVPMLDGVDAVMSMACGCGVQEVARRFKDKPVFPALNTKFMGASERQGVWAERCQGCGDCVLHLTGGICPVTRCAKSLFHGPCGGSVQGHCEVGKDTPCGWQLIIDRLKSLDQMDNYTKLKPYKGWNTSRDGGPRRIVREDMI